MCIYIQLQFIVSLVLYTLYINLSFRNSLFLMALLLVYLYFLYSSIGTLVFLSEFQNILIHHIPSESSTISSTIFFIFSISSLLIIYLESHNMKYSSVSLSISMISIKTKKMIILFRIYLCVKILYCHCELFGVIFDFI